jgi:hypothetical protein
MPNNQMQSMPEQNTQEQMQFSPEQSQQAQQQVMQILQESKLPPEKLVEIGEWAQRVIQNTNEFPAFPRLVAHTGSARK